MIKAMLSKGLFLLLICLLVTMPVLASCSGGDSKQTVDSVLTATNKMCNVAHFAADRPVVNLINGTSINYVDGGDPYIQKPSGETITAKEWGDVEFRIDADAPGRIKIEFDKNETVNGLLAKIPYVGTIWSDDDEANRDKSGIVKISYKITAEGIRKTLGKGVFSEPRKGQNYEEAFLGDLAEVVYGDRNKQDVIKHLIDKIYWQVG